MSIEEARRYTLRCDEGGCNAIVELDHGCILPPGWVEILRPDVRHFCPTSVRSLLGDHLREHPQP